MEYFCSPLPLLRGGSDRACRDSVSVAAVDAPLSSAGRAEPCPRVRRHDASGAAQHRAEPSAQLP